MIIIIGTVTGRGKVNICCNPVMSIYKLPHGQYGYSGHVINFPQDMQSFATSLPRLSADINVGRKGNRLTGTSMFAGELLKRLLYG